MTIEKYIDNYPPLCINGITFSLFGVNDPLELDIDDVEDLDIEEKTFFNDDQELSFLERLDKAKDEITNDTLNKSLDEVKTYYKGLTENGNMYYWGGMIFVPTDNMEEDGDTIYFGIRMDW